MLGIPVIIHLYRRYFSPFVPYPYTNFMQNTQNAVYPNAHEPVLHRVILTPENCIVSSRSIAYDYIFNVIWKSSYYVFEFLFITHWKEFTTYTSRQTRKIGPALARLRVHWSNIVPYMGIHWANFPDFSG